MLLVKLNYTKLKKFMLSYRFLKILELFDKKFKNLVLLNLFGHPLYLRT